MQDGETSCFEDLDEGTAGFIEGAPDALALDVGQHDADGFWRREVFIVMAGTVDGLMEDGGVDHDAVSFLYSRRRSALEEDPLEREVPDAVCIVIAEDAHLRCVVSRTAVAVERIEEFFRDRLDGKAIVWCIFAVAKNLELLGIVVFQDSDGYAHDAVAVIRDFRDAMDVDAFAVGIGRIRAIFELLPGCPEGAVLEVFKLQAGEPADVAEGLCPAVGAQEGLREGIAEADLVVLKEREDVLCGNRVQVANQEKLLMLRLDGVKEGTEQGEWRVGADDIAFLEDGLALGAQEVAIPLELLADARREVGIPASLVGHLVCASSVERRDEPFQAEGLEVLMKEGPEGAPSWGIGAAVDGLPLEALGVMREFFFDVPAVGIEFILLADLGSAEVPVLLIGHKHAPLLW